MPDVKFGTYFRRSLTTTLTIDISSLTQNMCGNGEAKFLTEFRFLLAKNDRNLLLYSMAVRVFEVNFFQPEIPQNFFEETHQNFFLIAPPTNIFALFELFRISKFYYTLSPGLNLLINFVLRVISELAEKIPAEICESDRKT